MHPDEFLAAADENFWESFRILARAKPDGETFEIDGILVVCMNVPVATFNVGFVTRPLDDPDGALRAVCAYFDERRLPFIVRMREGVDPGVERAAPAAGLPYSDALPGMIMHPPSAGNAGAGGLEIRGGRDERIYLDHVALCALGFGMAHEIARDVLRPAVAHEYELFVGYVDGKRAATSALVRTDATAGVYNLATDPPFRRRGYGEALTRHAVRRGIEDGCELACLQASPMGYPIYERMGFKPMARYRTFVRPSAPARGAAPSSSG